MSNINTQKLEYTGTTAPANTAKVAEAAFSGTHGGAASRAPAVVLVDASLQDATGAPATGVDQPAGGTGLLGWLSGIYARAGQIATSLAGNLSIRALSGAIDSISISNLPATQAISAQSLPLPADAAKESVQAVGNAHLSNISSRLPASIGPKASAASLAVVLASDQPAVSVKDTTIEAVSYYSGVAVIPTGLTAGLNFWWIRNASATKKIKIQKIEAILSFAGTAAASRSNYALKKFTAATATTGTVTLTPVAAVTTNPASAADIKWAAAGGTLTGAVVGATAIEIGHANQLTANISYDRNMIDAPLVLGTNEGLVLQSDGAIVAGSTVIISIRWSEE